MTVTHSRPVQSDERPGILKSAVRVQALLSALLAFATATIWINYRHNLALTCSMRERHVLHIGHRRSEIRDSRIVAPQPEQQLAVGDRPNLGGNHDLDIQRDVLAAATAQQQATRRDGRHHWDLHGAIGLGDRK